jgi:hypothetical protein
MIVQFKGDDWEDESEAEALEEEVQNALDAAGVDYLDVTVN